MRNLVKYSVSLVLTLLASLPMQAQSESSAFYIYQNDGHFDGFFYDQVQKMSFSKLDTLGVEHDEFVSQEIITADSTYRIMLSAIDSVGFVQPEMKYNPRLRLLRHRPNLNKGVGSLPVDPLSESSWGFNNSEYYLYFDDIPKYNYHVPVEHYPVVGDVFTDFSTFAVKVTKVENYAEGNAVGVMAWCEDITDISDVIHNLVAVEEIEADKKGNLIRRRVAGHPELTVGSYSRRQASGSFEGDLFNFSLNGHIPIVNTDKFKVSIDPSISGALTLKCTWNIPLIGSKYISIEDKLKVEASVGVTASGQLADKCYGGFGMFGQFYVPATAPILVIDLGPDGFVRGQASINLSFTSQPAKGCIWEKWEIKDWWPYYTHGYGDPDDSGNSSDSSSDSKYSKELTLSGFIQSGVNFPMKLKSLPFLKKVFDASLGGEWFIGPKLSAEVKIDLSQFNVLRAGEHWATKPTAGYSALKGTKLSLSLLDADYEISAEVATLFSPKKKWTLADGTFTLLSSMDLRPVPEFSECDDKEEMRTFDGKSIPCRILSFTPSGNVLMPVNVGVELLKVEGWNGIKEYGDEGIISGWQDRNYPYHQTETLTSSLSGDESRNKVELVLKRKVSEGEKYYDVGGKYRVRPFVEFAGSTWPAEPSYDFYEGACLRATQPQLEVNFDGTVDEPLKFEGTCDDLYQVKYVRSQTDEKLPNYVKVEGEKDNLTLSVKQKEFIDKFGKNYSIKRERKNLYNMDFACYGIRHMEGDVVAKTPGSLEIPFVQKPNDKENPVKATVRGYSSYDHVNTNHGYVDIRQLPNEGVANVITRIEKEGWNCTGTYEDDDETMNYTFDVIEADDRSFSVQNGTLNYQLTKIYTDSRGESHTAVATVSGTFGGHQMKLEGHAIRSTQGGTSNMTLSVTEDGIPQSTQPYSLSSFKLVFADGLVE